MIQDSSCEVASFVGENAQGNTHVILRSEVAGGEIEILSQALSQTLSPRIVVVLKTDKTNKHRAVFFHFGRRVQRCGSGCLAVAHILFDECSRDSLRLETPAGPVVLRRHPQAYSFQMSVLPYHSTTQRRVWQGLVNRPIATVTLVGGKTDYCIVELHAEKDVKNCVINSRCLCRISRRGLIVTAPSADKNDDYVMRYFAPQYGQKEDAATGSANAMLANYWQQRLQKSGVCGRQLSALGGAFRIEKCGLQQRVIGRTKLLSSSGSLL